MAQRLLYILKYYLFWIVLFVLAKIAFLFYQFHESFSLEAITWFRIIGHGLKLDLSMAGYLTLFPALIITFTSFSSFKSPSLLINTYTAIVIFIFLVITFIDFEAYKYWGSRLDSAPLRFLDKPGETLASTSVITLIIYITLLIVLVWLLYVFYKRKIAVHLQKSAVPGLKGLPVYLLTTLLLFIPIRGGLGVSPINTGSVYFSKIPFANHAAINVVWNFGQSLVEGKESSNPYIFSNDTNYTDALFDLYSDEGNTVPVLKFNRPNIILIILESFSAKLIEPLGGKEDVTPEFNRLSGEGIFFTNIFSTDSRTDKGVASILSGYPVLEPIPIMRYTEKTQNLPFLTRSLIDHGYYVSFMYGGDVDFANMRSYLINAGINRITNLNDFPKSMRTGKWGVPDHLVYDRFFLEVVADTGKWFRILLTLSNHEPFEIPGHPKFGDNTLVDRFYSSAYYADSCLGQFIDRFRETPLWDSTLIVLVADHGTRLPEFDNIFEPRKHHIPMLFTGGAVLKDSVVSKTGTQADLAITLLKQTGIRANGYILGKDLLSPGSQSFAFYSIKNGIAMVNDSGGFGYDFISKSISYSYGSIDTSHVSTAKAFQQYVFDNYLNLSR